MREWTIKTCGRTLRALSMALEQVGLGIGGKRFIGLEEAVGAVTPRMHNALWDALVVKVEDLFPEMEAVHDE